MYCRSKKIVALILIFAMVLTTFVGCAEEEQKKAGHVSDFDSQTHFQPGTSGEDSQTEANSTEQRPVTGEFVVNEKKYDYNDANLMLLSVENQTDTHYNVTIKGKYFDKNGETIKEETQTYECFPAGWQNYFIFYPKVAFDKFTYTLETEKYQTDALTADKNGVPYATQYELTYERELKWEREPDFDNGSGGIQNPRDVRKLYCPITLINHHSSTTISVEFHALVLDEQGDIYVTSFDYIAPGGGYSINGTDCSPVGGMHEDGKHSSRIDLKKQEIGGDETIPENVQGKFTVIFAIKYVEDEDVLFERYPLGK